jgi:hypothetical protein
VDGIGDSISFTAKQLREDMRGCLAVALVAQGGTKEELDELQIYMCRFLRDVDEDFPEVK